MRPRKIQLSRVSVTLLLLFVAVSTCLLPSSVTAQSCGGTLESITYDTTVTSTVSNTGSAGGSFTYSIPQFHASLLTLYAVVIKSTVSADASMTIMNLAPTAAIPSVQLIRSDGISSAGTGSVNGIPVFSSSYTGASIAPFSSGPVSLPSALDNTQLVNDSITTLDPSGAFFGTGSIPFTYSSNNIAFPAGGMIPT